MEKQLKLFSSKVYCVDTSTLINFKEYPRDLFPTIWKKIETMVKGDQLISHSEVYREIKIGHDEISRWCKGNKKMFKDVDECQSKKLQDVKSKYDPNYWDRENNGTNPWADPWVIATSICEGATIVADESNKTNRIPAIARTLGVTCLNRFDFFRQIGVKY